MCDPVIFSNVSPEQWAAIEAKLATAHIRIEHDQGEIVIQSADIRWDYESSAKTLTVQCVRKPFIIPCSKVNAKITELFQKEVSG
ncbi:MAG TPA: hypothetical protein VNH18_29540 [Bryobacteraceae bacterium]|nr:hypothetical protein [Blastocatellia bacterium]HXJ43462.1 hypothetical protein [Bryobacteraceae bacterium]